MLEPDALLILPRIRVQNANAISSALTWGFPSPSAFTGFVHALQRRLNQIWDVRFEGVAIICHEFEPQVSSPAGKRTKVFHLTRNPVGKDGSTPAFVEEGRAYLNVSLVVGVTGDDIYSGKPINDLAAEAWHIAAGMRLAGGTILPSTRALRRHEKPEIHTWPGEADEGRRLSRRIARHLLPGFALLSREALLNRHWEELCKSEHGSTQLDALLDLSRLNFRPVNASDNAEANGEERADWEVKPKKGWLVPIPAGYRALSPLYEPGEVKNARDRDVPFRFVEGVLTIGQWLSPLRVDDVRKLLWIHDADPVSGLYRCTTPYFAKLLETEGN